MLGKPAQELQAFSSAATTPNVAILAMPKRLKDERRLINSLSNLTRSTCHLSFVRNPRHSGVERKKKKKAEAPPTLRKLPVEEYAKKNAKGEWVCTCGKIFAKGETLARGNIEQHTKSDEHK